MLIDTSSENIGCQIVTWKGIPHPLSLGKYKLKPCALPYIPHVQNVNLSARPSSRKDAEQWVLTQLLIQNQRCKTQFHQNSCTRKLYNKLLPHSQNLKIICNTDVHQLLDD